MEGRIHTQFITEILFQTILYSFPAEKIPTHIADAFAAECHESDMLWVDGRAKISNRNIDASQSHLS